MSNLRTGIIAVLAVSLGGLYLADRVWGHHDARTVEQQLARIERERGALEKLSRSLEAEQTRMRDHERVVVAQWGRSGSNASDPGRWSPASVEVGPADGAAPRGPDPHSEPEPLPPTTEEVYGALEDAFIEHSDEPSWSRGAEQRIYDGLLASVGDRTALASVRCNGAMCRIESDHDDMGSFRRFAEESVLGPDGGLWNAGIFTSVVEGGDDGQPVTAVTFVAREGEPLPGVSD